LGLVPTDVLGAIGYYPGGGHAGNRFGGTVHGPAGCAKKKNTTGRFFFPSGGPETGGKTSAPR